MPDIQFFIFLWILALFFGLSLRAVEYINDEIPFNYIPFTFDVDFLEVTSIKFSPPNNITTNQPDNAQFRLNLTVNTKTAKFFRPVQVTVEYDDQLVSSTTIAPFHQDALSAKTIPVLMGTVNTGLPDKVIESISNKLASEGVLDFTVIIRGDNWNVVPRRRAGYTCDMKMVCQGMAVRFSSTNNTWNGSTKGGPFSCKYNSKYCNY